VLGHGTGSGLSNRSMNHAGPLHASPRDMPCPIRRAQMEAVRDGAAGTSAGAAAGVRLHRVSIQEWRLYTRAFVLRLPLHRSLPIAFWLALGRLLGWRAPVPQVRRRVIRRAAPAPAGCCLSCSTFVSSARSASGWAAAAAPRCRAPLPARGWPPAGPARARVRAEMHAELHP